MGSEFRNQEGYADPTAGQAIAQVIKEERKYRPLVYICSPFSNAPEGNTEKAKRYSRFAVDCEAIPFAPHLLLPLYMKEDSERAVSLCLDESEADRFKNEKTIYVSEEEERRAKKYEKYMGFARTMSSRELREAYVELMIELDEYRLKEKYGR